MRSTSIELTRSLVSSSSGTRFATSIVGVYHKSKIRRVRLSDFCTSRRVRAEPSPPLFFLYSALKKSETSSQSCTQRECVDSVIFVLEGSKKSRFTSEKFPEFSRVKSALLNGSSLVLKTIRSTASNIPACNAFNNILPHPDDNDV